MDLDKLKQSPLGKNSAYVDKYSSNLLFPISRRDKREELGIGDELPFQGVDVWNAYEVSWLNSKGKPEIAIVEFYIPANSPNIIEAKSFKLYLNSYNQTRLNSSQEVQQRLVDDISREAGCIVDVRLLMGLPQGNFPGSCLDELDVTIDKYQVDPHLLKCSQDRVEEEVYSHLLKSNCLVTEQPDWGSIYIHYVGHRIDHASLLEYLISYRQHNEFHEQCIERIFMDIINECQPEELTVFGKYTRRGGLDINPFRSNFETCPSNFRLPRQ